MNLGVFVAGRSVQSPACCVGTGWRGRGWAVVAGGVAPRRRMPAQHRPGAAGCIGVGVPRWRFGGTDSDGEPESQGWKAVQSSGGPLKYLDSNGIERLVIKRGSPRTPGSDFPHVAIRDASGQRVDPYGNIVTRRAPGNHTQITWDLP